MRLCRRDCPVPCAALIALERPNREKVTTGGTLANLRLSDLDQLVVGCWVELNQNLADDADALVIDHGRLSNSSSIKFPCEKFR